LPIRARRRERPDPEVQRATFERAQAERFRWVTGAPGFAETEDELLRPLVRDLSAPMLEIGCGEGNNLLRFAAVGARTGVDLFPNKLAFAAGEQPEVHFAAADAARLPFANAVFGSVFVRDLLHHVQEPRAVLREVTRVLRPGGRFVLLEPNGRNPLVWLQTRIVAAEAGARDFDAELLSGFLSGLAFDDLRFEARQPLPLRRALLHYDKGIPALGRNALARKLLASGERALGALLPRSRWTYLLITARRAGSSP
jgi:SAM-dependent methyltransferase